MFEAREVLIYYNIDSTVRSVKPLCDLIAGVFFFFKNSVFINFLAKVGKRENTPDTGKLRKTSLNFTTFLEDVMYKCPIEPSYK